MWPLAECISSTLVRTPSWRLGVLQSLRGSFQFVQSRPLTLLAHTSSGLWSEVTTSLSLSKAAQVRYKGVNPFTIATIVTIEDTAYKGNLREGREGKKGVGLK